jgi:hypothetical protein
MNGDPSKDYFSAGAPEELLNYLVKTPFLGVAARTSSFAFRAVGERARGRETRPHHGAAHHRHRWLPFVVRNLGSRSSPVLAVQAEIARAITIAFTHKLLGASSTGSATKPTINLESYRKYLEGRDFYGPRMKAGG